MDLDSKERNRLRSVAHSLKPAVLIGKNGLTDESIENIRKALDDHELIKVKFNAFKEEKDALTKEILVKTGAELINQLGNTIVLYVKKTDPD